MSGHSPGEWGIRDIPTPDLYIGQTHDGGSAAIAIVPKRTTRSDAEQMANARLMAASPLLLIAAQMAYRTLARRPEFADEAHNLKLAIESATQEARS